MRWDKENCEYNSEVYKIAGERLSFSGRVARRHVAADKEIEERAAAGVQTWCENDGRERAGEARIEKGRVSSLSVSTHHLGRENEKERESIDFHSARELLLWPRTREEPRLYGV